MPDQGQMREFYDVMVACGMNVPPIEAWLAHYSLETELWPITDSEGPCSGHPVQEPHGSHRRPARVPRPLGIAKLLRAYRAWTHDCDIFATPHQDNRRAIEFAKRLGFQESGSRGEFIILKKESTCHPH